MQPIDILLFGNQMLQYQRVASQSFPASDNSIGGNLDRFIEWDSGILKTRYLMRCPCQPCHLDGVILDLWIEGIGGFHQGNGGGMHRTDYWRPVYRIVIEHIVYPIELIQ
jgi:hypothetical protein